jgi:hypothetical protein
MRSLLMRVLARERGLFAGAVIIATAVAAFGVPFEFVLFGLTLAGVALSNMYPEAKSVGRWLVHGWHVTLAYIVGFGVMLAVTGWHPTPKRGAPVKPVAEAVQPHAASQARDFTMRSRLAVPGNAE